MKTIIIAEAGVNHNGSLEIAKNLVIAAAEAGADFIKFQTFSTEKLVLRNAAQAEYQKKNLGKNTSQFEMLKKLELSLSDHKELIKFCNLQKIAFFSTAFDFDSIRLLNNLDLPMWKIPSGEITNLPYLQLIGSFGKPIVLSTGMATLGEIEDAIGIIESAGTERDKITVLHCTTEYPAPLEEVNLTAMVTVGNAFKVRYGYSDHTEGIEIPMSAVALGACIIEKHLTLDKAMIGPDHKASLEPEEFKKMVDGIRRIEIALGSGIKKPTRSEIKNRVIARKSIVASKVIKTGEIFTTDNLDLRRPGTGISPMQWNKIIGTKSSRDYSHDELIDE